MVRLWRWWAVLAGCFCSVAALAAAPATIEGRVDKVVDGDSLWLTPAAGRPIEVRLLGIDAPEGCQAGGPEARRALEAMALRRDASLRTEGRDQHGRTLGTLFVGGVNVNQTLVEDGHAWSMRFKRDQGPYVQQERAAQALNRGVFANGGAVLPRDFRRNHGPCQAGESPRPSPTAGQAALPVPPQNTTAPATRSSPSATATATATATSYRCDGRTRCSQMSSCAEATFFLKNCPGVKMDGDGNGVPCEQQVCGKP